MVAEKIRFTDGLPSKVGRLRTDGLKVQAGKNLLWLLADVAERMGVARFTRVFVSTLVRSPVVVGFLRPMVLLPASLTYLAVLVGTGAIRPEEIDWIRQRLWHRSRESEL